MHQFEYQYDPSEKPKMVDIFMMKIPCHEAHQTEWAKTQGEIILMIDCEDGMCYVIRKEFYTKKPGEK